MTNCIFLAKFQNHSLHLELQDCGITAGHKLQWSKSRHIDHSFCSEFWSPLAVCLPHLPLAVLYSRPSLVWLGCPCVSEVCVCMWDGGVYESGLDTQSILQCVYIYICPGSMCLEHQSHGSPRPSGKLAVVIKFDMKEWGKERRIYKGEQKQRRVKKKKRGEIRQSQRKMACWDRMEMENQWLFGRFGAGGKIMEGTGSCKDRSAETHTHTHSSCRGIFCRVPTLPKWLLIQQMLSEIWKFVSILKSRACQAISSNMKVLSEKWIGKQCNILGLLISMTFIGMEVWKYVWMNPVTDLDPCHLLTMHACACGLYFCLSVAFVSPSHTHTHYYTVLIAFTAFH